MKLLLNEPIGTFLIAKDLTTPDGPFMVRKTGPNAWRGHWENGTATYSSSQIRDSLTERIVWWLS